MMKRSLPGFAVSALALTLAFSSDAGAQRGQTKGSPAATARAGIDSAWDRFMGFARAGNTAAMAGMYAEDATLVEPAVTVTGRENIEKAMRAWFATARYFGRTRQQTSLDISGDLLVESGTFSESFQERGKARVKNEGRYLVVWRRAGGAWQVQRDVELPNPPPMTK